MTVTLTIVVLILPPIAQGQICPPLITDPTPLNTNAATDEGLDIGALVATDGAGTWVAVWRSTDTLGGKVGDDPDIFFARSFDEGQTWTDPTALNTNAGSDSGKDWLPRLATDDGSIWIVVWPSNDPLEGTIGHDFDILFARSTDGGASWSAPAPLNTNASTDSHIDAGVHLATDGFGKWVSVWHSKENLGGTIGYDYDILFALSVDNGSSWSPPGPLNTDAEVDAQDDSPPWIATDGAGNWIVAWDRGQWGGPPGTDFDILFARSTDGGLTWSDPAPLNTNAPVDIGNDQRPRLTTDGAGNWIAAWQSSDDLGGTVGTELDIFFARSTDNGATWTDPHPLNTDASFDSFTDHAPDIVTDKAGNWVAVWDAFVLGGFPPDDGDVFFSVSRDDGASWSDRVPLNTNAVFDTGVDLGPQVATDGLGQWIAVWSSDENLEGSIGTDRDILLARFQTGNSAPVMICHIPPGDPGNLHTLIVPESAVPAHLAHGDICGGPCGAPHPPASASSGSEVSDCPSDLDSDGSVASADLALLLGSWGPCADRDDCPADLDDDGQVGSFDLAILLGAWAPCPP